jgi:hemolysin III
MSLPSDHPRLTRRPFSQGELVADGLVHAAALFAAVIGLAVLITLVLMKRGGLELSAVAVYGVGLISMFGFSAAYNMAPPSSLKWLLRRFDHSSIYLMIAGTYTPLLTLVTDTYWAIILALVVWIGAIAGIVLKVALPGRFDKLSIGIYLMLGWVAVAAIKPLIASLPPLTMILLAAGGLLYSTGVAFYVWRNLKFNNVIWHGFVAAAAGCHFAAITHAMMV